MAHDARTWIAELRSSHDRLASVVEDLPVGGATAPSYCADWTVAQVLSHLGSGAEIAHANLDAALAGSPTPSRDTYQAIWDRWNAKTPAAMAADAVVADDRHVARLEGLTDDELAAVTMDFMGRILDATGIVGLRLGEHAVHTWDVHVAFDVAATIPSGPTRLLVDLLPARAGRLARGDRPAAAPADIAVDTTGPLRSFVLRLADDVALATAPASAAGDPPAGRVTINGEALLRLVYGRLDPAHTPEGTLARGPVSLDDLRALFPGF